MSKIRPQTLLLVLFGALALMLPACGGGGDGGGGSTSSFRIMSTSIPPSESAGLVDYEIAIDGGCGGPYEIQKLSGSLPPGVAIIDKESYDDDRYEDLGFTQFEHRIYGAPLDDGDYTFTLQIVDTGCRPFASASGTYQLQVSVGNVAVVEVEQDGNPSLIEPGGTSYNPDYPALPKTIYNDFTSMQFIIAGGVGPYAMKLWDDPSIPNDADLPLGVSISATSLVGAPVEVGPDGGPFLCSFEIHDSVGEVAYFTVYWKVDTPAIIVATESISNGQAGQTYSDQFLVAGGVPPFEFEFVEVGMPEGYTSDANPNPSNPDADVMYNPGAPPTVSPDEVLSKIDATMYPSETDQGPDYGTSNQGIPSEGMYLTESTGSFSGIPRRRGTYSVNMHVMSTLVPNSFGQHAWATYAYEITSAGPIEHDPDYTLDTAFPTNPPYAQIAGADQGEEYNPDGGVDGLQLIASGGVPQDGRTDGPHKSQTTEDEDETYGAFTWAVNWDPDEEGNAAVEAMELTADGIFRIEEGREDDLVPMLNRALGFTAIDYALPSNLATTQEEKVRMSIGPDRVVITLSETSFVAASSSYDNRPQNDTDQDLWVLTSRSTGSPSLDPVATENLTGNGDDKIGVPEDAGDITPAKLLSGMDITRISVNPTGWWDDTYHINPRGARPFQHGDNNACYYVYGIGYNGYYYRGTSSYYVGKYQWQPTATCVRLPKAESIKADKAKGVYNDGGKFYIYETATHIGVFVIRKDTRIYLPAAFDKKSTGWYSFGDNWVKGHASSVVSGVKIPQMTVSPDGRVAALKIRSDPSCYMYETADDSAILLISLTGEPRWDGEVYKIIGTGSNGGTTQGQYQFASSLTLTNDYLYYLIGSGSTTYLSWKDHYIYRYELDGGEDDGGLLHEKFNSNWTNTAGSAMQTPFQMYYGTFVDSYGNPDDEMYMESGYNGAEFGTAPHPFRVNADGNACAIVAGTTTSSTSGSTVMKHHVWVDYEGELTQLSPRKWRYAGGGRGYQLDPGVQYSPVAHQWGTFMGPSTRLEISDDGLSVAATYSRTSTQYGTTSYSSTKYHYREDIAAFTTSNDWGTVTVHEITGDTSTSTSPSAAKFRPSTSWRFGALTFTAAGDGLVFYGGRPNYSPTATYSSSSSAYYMYYGAKSVVGSVYSYGFSDKSVRNIFSSSDGGAKDTVGSALTSISYSTSSWQTDGGVVKPLGGFLSMNRNFLYLCNRGALTTSQSEDARLIGVNIRSLNTGQSVNGHTDGRAFRVGGFASLHGFADGAYPYHSYGGLGYYYYYPGYNWYYTYRGGNTTTAATDNGRVFFVSGVYYSSTITSTSTTYGGPVRPTNYGYPDDPKKLYVFDPNVGGAVQEIASKWGGATSYHIVGGLEVADDGTAVACAYTTAAYYNWQDREKFSAWGNVQLNASTGVLDKSALITNHIETGTGYVGSHWCFGSNNVDVFYAQGSSNENNQDLKKATVDGGSAVNLNLGKKNYNVLHAGR